MKLDPVDQKTLKGPHSSAKDKDINNDGKVNSSDEYLHKRRQAVSKALGKLKEAALEEKKLTDKQVKNALASAKAKPKETVSLKKPPFKIDEAVNEKQIRKDLDSGMSHDVVIGKHANKKTSNTDEIRKVIKQHAFDKRMKKEEVELDELSKKTLGSYRTKAARDDKDRSKGRNISSAKMYPDQYKNSPLKAKVSATEEVELDEEVGKVTGYFVTGRDNKKTHDKPFTTSSAAIAHADAKETKTGHVHTVHHIKDGKIQKQWQYSDSAGKFAPYNDHAGENHSIRERVELDEVSQDKLYDYHAKAAADLRAKREKLDKGTLTMNDLKKGQNRVKGLNTAANKMKEEVDLDEVKKPKPGNNAMVMAKNIGKVLSAVKKEEAPMNGEKPLRMKLTQFRNQE